MVTNDNNILRLSVKEAKNLELLLRDTFNFSVYKNLCHELSYTETSQKEISILTEEELVQRSQCLTGKGIDIAKFGLLFDDDTITVECPNLPLESLKNLTDKYLQKDEIELKDSIILITAILFRDRNLYMTYPEGDEASYKLDEYFTQIRPDMLKLYIAINKQRKGNNVRISFGNNIMNKKYELENTSGWFDEMLNRYLWKYLGVTCIEEAQRELDIIYYKDTGRTPDKQYNRYVWGLYKLLSNSSMSSKPTMNIIKFTYDYSLLVGFYTPMYKSKEFYSDDLNKLKSRINTLIKKFDNVEDLYKSTEYKLSPNNPDFINWGTSY